MKQTTIITTQNPAAKRGSPFYGRPVRLGELVYGAWAIQPSYLEELQSIYEMHLRGDKIDLPALEARLGRPLANEQRDYELVSGVAVLSIEGVMAPKANLFMRISGGASTQMIADQVGAAAADNGVRSILLVIDSPGGSVLGTPELGQAIREAAASTPVVARCDGVMASAAYWAGSAANAVYITGPTVMAGNIGVVGTHTDTSVADARSGIKKTEITAGKYKRIASSLEPLTPEGRASMQEQVDYLYSIFVDVVAENRGVDVQTVLDHMADGRVFIGQQAIDAGLVDGVSTLDALIGQMASNPAAFQSRRKAQVKAAGKKKSTSAGAAAEDDSAEVQAAADPATTTPEGQTMPGENQTVITREILQKDHAAVYAEIHAAGVAAEISRANAVRAMSVPGHEKLIAQLAADGKTTGPEAAAAIVVAQQETLKAARAAHENDAPQAARNGGSGGASDVTTKTKAEQVAEAKDYAAKNNVDFVAAMKHLGFAS
jgi:signal peptide peptidase SppA